ncbi:hypothetical protein ACULMA_17295 [Xanthomonas arboricola pv. corylina]|uniref:hypothetical protein n=1 Tax=Xanthomonas arboricola TaxID=56448 RepID=UPI0040408F18
MAFAYYHKGATVLLLTNAEASTLLQVMRRIGGDPEKTARKHADAIAEALLAAAVEEAAHDITNSGNSAGLNFHAPKGDAL